MSQNASIDPSILEALNAAQEATMAPQVVLTSGAGKAYQMVAQASALAIQDAVDSLRAAGTLADAATAAALSQATATGEPRYLEIVRAMDDMRLASVAAFQARAAAAIETLKNFPSG